MLSRSGSANYDRSQHMHALKALSVLHSAFMLSHKIYGKGRQIEAITSPALSAALLPSSLLFCTE